MLYFVFQVHTIVCNTKINTTSLIMKIYHTLHFDSSKIEKYLNLHQKMGKIKSFNINEYSEKFYRILPHAPWIISPSRFHIISSLAMSHHSSQIGVPTLWNHGSRVWRRWLRQKSLLAKRHHCLIVLATLHTTLM